jgi:hypothetical protein
MKQYKTKSKGERVEDTPLSRSINCTAIVWHPTEYLLCTGWKDGKNTKHILTIHRSDIRVQ